MGGRCPSGILTLLFILHSNVRFVCSHFTNYLKYIFYFILGQFVLCTSFQLTSTVRATFQLTYISAYWDSPNLCFQGAKSTPKRGFKSSPKWGPLLTPGLSRNS